MKTVVIACGAGVATSTMVKMKVEDILKKNKIKANIIQTRLSELPGYDNKSDLFITTMKVDQRKYKTQVVQGSSFLSGINQDKTEKEIVDALK